MHLRRARMLAVVAATVVVLASAACSGAAAPAVTRTTTTTVGAAPAALPAAPADVRWPGTGALFGGPPADPGEHFCSSAVIDSPAGDLVVTAAHCVAAGDGGPARTGMSFVPGYHDHVLPFGAFTVTAAYVDDEWRQHGDPDHDVAFLTVSRAGSPPVEQLTGGYRLALGAAVGGAVDAIGYPDFADAPTERSGITRARSATQLRLDARGLYDGTSGGPWLLTDGPDGRDVDVVGVTGGFEQGGLDPETSYAVHLGPAAGALLATATGSG